MPVVLSIAGSDSGGGAGIQADLKVFHACECFGTTAVTCVTAQNPDAVRGVEPLSPAMVTDQIHAVCEGFPVAATKTGMLFSAAIIKVVAASLAHMSCPNLVVDPVMVATSGARLLREDAITALQSTLIPMATVMTPNLPEAEVLAGHSIESLDALKQTARELADRFEVACALKGGHLALNDTIVDVLCDGHEIHTFETPRLAAVETHGTGCTFSAMVAAKLAHGASIPEAVYAAQKGVVKGLSEARRAGGHAPLWI